MSIFEKFPSSGRGVKWFIGGPLLLIKPKFSEMKNLPYQSKLLVGMPVIFSSIVILSPVTAHRVINNVLLIFFYYYYHLN